MPRISGRSSLITESLMRCRPSARTVRFWSLGRSMTLRRWVTLSFLAIGQPPVLRELGLRARLGGGDGLEHGPGCHLPRLLVTQARDVLRQPKAAKTRDGGVHDVQRVPGTHGLRKDVLDPGALQHGTHRATGDDTG